ncbi:MAG: DUF2795 domain-containing protein [Anaerolineae bacterium]|jgi:hypothetical protein
MSSERGRSQRGGQRSEQGGGQRSGQGGGINPVMIQSYLEGVDYPTSKDTLVRTARDQGAPDNIISFLEELPDREYESPVDVSRHAGKRSKS